MATVGEILRRERIKKNFTLSQVEQATKIRLSFLENLEESRYQDLPSSTYARGFVKNYAEFLGLPQESLLARLRRELKDPFSTRRTESVAVLPKSIDLEQELSLRRVRVTGLFLVGALLLISLFFYLLIQYRGFLGAPTLAVETPYENQSVQGQTLTVSGKTDPDASVKINDEFVEVLKDGNFQKSLTVFQGTFIYTVTATNRFGRETSVTRTVKVE